MGGSAEERAKKRKILLEEQDYRCAYCGVHHDDSYLTVDHIVPTCNGGPNNMNNFQMLCNSCNRDKGTMEDPYCSVQAKIRARERIIKRAKSNGIQVVNFLPS